MKIIKFKWFFFTTQLFNTVWVCKKNVLLITVNIVEDFKLDQIISEVWTNTFYDVSKLARGALGVLQWSNYDPLLTKTQCLWLYNKNTG